MIGKREAKKIVTSVIKMTKADQVEVSIVNYKQALTRFANNYIHQNVSEANSSIAVRVVFGKKIGIASTNSLQIKKIKETVEWAESIAHLQRENNDFVSLPRAPRSDYRSPKIHVRVTEDFSERQRAEAVDDIIQVAKKNGMNTFGSVSNGTAEICIGNSLGIRAYSICGDAFCNIVMATGNSTGYAQAGSRDVRDIDFRELAGRAARKAQICADPKDISPGRYTTIFEPLAASEFLNFMSYYAFNGKMFQEGRSFLSNRLGSRVVDERITVIDDPFAPHGFAFPFDFEGVPKRKLVLIDKGIAKNVAHDSLTAFKEKKMSTGHALRAPNPFGPVPLNSVMKSGEDSLDDMIRGTDRGILVTRFHYTNVIDPHKLIITGMTRDGTFLIENGKITGGVKNLRFTENIIEVLNRVESLSDTSVCVANDPGYGARFATGIVVPAIKVRDFNFTSATEF
ncbi:MAG: TldD/PmbA family protein [candidate division WOR-3 bacterium]|nr:MAG: TldD/PmbA family protein [candidate division WOR-3 bacterium]